MDLPEMLPAARELGAARLLLALVGGDEQPRPGRSPSGRSPSGSVDVFVVRLRNFPPAILIAFDADFEKPILRLAACGRGPGLT